MLSLNLHLHVSESKESCEPEYSQTLILFTLVRVGDFNAIRCEDEPNKPRGSPRNRKSFNEFINKNALMDLSMTGELTPDQDKVNREHILEQLVAAVHSTPSLKDFRTANTLSIEPKPLVGNTTVIKKVILPSMIGIFTRSSTLEIYGSYMSRVSTRSGDLDVSVNVSSGLSDPSDSPPKSKKMDLLRDLCRTLFSKGGFEQMQVIGGKYPIIKMVSRHNGLSCDISICNKRGCIKSMIIKYLSDIDDRFTDLILLLKEWIRAHNVTSGNKFFNSYSLCLMAIFHLQTCMPAILPPLKEVYPRDVIQDFKVSKVRKDEILKACFKNITDFQDSAARVKNESSTFDLLRSFILKFCGIKEMADKWVICTYKGTLEKRANSKWIDANPLIIEDPFEQSENAARTVSKSHIESMQQAICKTQITFFWANNDKDEVIPALVRPEIYESLKSKYYGFIGYGGKNKVSQGHPFPGVMDHQAHDYTTASALAYAQQQQAVNHQQQLQFGLHQQFGFTNSSTCSLVWPDYEAPSSSLDQEQQDKQVPPATQPE
ncbi:hypothetical protein BVC80_399g2 [Macleaya cordata]|uniref:Poly(A) RNA polymerase mitochondrial-like central palm domain-containing protein n=1 Tax=Macleaya cordata TaxID=56857 RepID=A0A200R189_MACCD|nr:hypothetical protein BVC80_399g2 [Macleaya cordata]